MRRFVLCSQARHNRRGCPSMRAPRTSLRDTGGGMVFEPLLRRTPRNNRAGQSTMHTLVAVLQRMLVGQPLRKLPHSVSPHPGAIHREGLVRPQDQEALKGIDTAVMQRRRRVDIRRLRPRQRRIDRQKFMRRVTLPQAEDSTAICPARRWRASPQCPRTAAKAQSSFPVSAQSSG